MTVPWRDLCACGEEFDVQLVPTGETVTILGREVPVLAPEPDGHDCEETK